MIALEAELAQLKPLLLMRPFALTHSHMPAVVTPKLRKKTREGEGDAQENADELSLLEDMPSPPKTFRPKGQYYRRRDELIPALSPQTHTSIAGPSKKQRLQSRSICVILVALVLMHLPWVRPS